MATLLDLARQGAISKFEPNLEPTEQEVRCIYAGPKLVKWINEVLPSLESDRGLESTPLMQFIDLTSLFCSGGTLCFDWHFKPLQHVEDGIWELKTSDLRIFGWFPQKDWFIGVIGDTKRRILDYGLYGPYAKVEVAPFRAALDLDPPKFVPGVDPHDVVSDFDFAD